VSTSIIRVRYAETDQMGVAYHGGYFAWFEVGRTDLLRTRGMTYKDLEAADLRLPVIEAGARFLKPALYDDLIEVRTRVAEHSGALVVDLVPGIFLEFGQVDPGRTTFELDRHDARLLAVPAVRLVEVSGAQVFVDHRAERLDRVLHQEVPASREQAERRGRDRLVQALRDGGRVELVVLAPEDEDRDLELHQIQKICTSTNKFCTGPRDGRCRC